MGHLYNYLEQSKALATIDELDSPGDRLRAREAIDSQSRQAIESYKNGIADGTVKPRVLPNGLEIHPAPPVDYFDSSRSTNSEAMDILDKAARDFRSPTRDVRFVGLMSIDPDSHMATVVVTEYDYVVMKTTKMRLGKYLGKLGTLTPDEVNTITNSVKSEYQALAGAEVSFARTEDEVIDVYVNGPNSCMSGDSFFSGHIHPAAVYGDSDLSVAYVQIGGRIRARVVVCEEDKTYSCAYGNYDLITRLLDDMGYTEGDMYGKRIRAIYDSAHSSYIMPYLDSADECAEDGEWLVIGECGGIHTNSTHGLSNMGYCCDHCGDHVDEDECYHVGDGEMFCSDTCVEDAGWHRDMSSRWEEFEHEDKMVQCISNEEWYSDTIELVCVDDEYYLQDDDAIVYSEYENEWYLSGECTYSDKHESYVHDSDYDEDEELEHLEECEA